MNAPRAFVREPGPLADIAIPAVFRPIPQQEPPVDRTPVAQAADPQRWAIIELFGRQRIAGAVSEQTFAGAGLVRVDVPEVTVRTTDYVDGQAQPRTKTIPPHTASFGPAAIYSIKWVDEATAMLAAQHIEHVPLQSYQLRDALQGLTLGDRRYLLADGDGA